MGQNSNIEWTDHTFNPWVGCSKVSPGCLHCYAEGWSKRSGLVKWGPGQPRRRTSEANWRGPVKWDREARETIARIKADTGNTSEYQTVDYERPRVFCASLADWLDEEVPVAWLADLFKLIHATPNLDWLLLTKRPQNFSERMEAVLDYGIDVEDALDAWLDGRPPANVWIGTTVEDQTRADERTPHLLKIPATVRFLSCEPLLGPVILPPSAFRLPPSLHWVICGGESGPQARPLHPAWARSLRDQCAAADVPFFFKQWGEFVPLTPLYEGRDEDAELGSDPDRTSVLYDTGWLWNDSLGQPYNQNRPWLIERVGKSAAGRLLDGMEHHAFPTLMHDTLR